MPIETALQHIRRSRWPNELSHNVISRREKSGIGTRVAQYAGDPGVLGIIRIVIYLFYYPYFIMTPGPWSEDDDL